MLYETTRPDSCFEASLIIVWNIFLYGQNLTSDRRLPLCSIRLIAYLKNSSSPEWLGLYSIQKSLLCMQMTRCVKSCSHNYATGQEGRFLGYTPSMSLVFNTQTFWAETETRRCSFRDAGRDLGSFKVSPRRFSWRMVKHIDNEKNIRIN